jgi:hypothetical protein
MGHWYDDDFQTHTILLIFLQIHRPDEMALPDAVSAGFGSRSARSPPSDYDTGSVAVGPNRPDTSAFFRGS